MIPGYLLFLIAVTVITFLMGTGLARARARTRIQRIVTRADELIKEGKREEAVLFLDELIRDGPTVPEREQGLLLLGNTLEQLGRRLEAQRAYMLYLQEFETNGDPESVAQVNQRLGNLMVGPHSLSPWKQFLRDAEDREATPEDRIYGLIDARHMLEQGRFEEALDVLARLTRQKTFTGREVGLLYLALTYEGMHRQSEALDTYQQYLDEYVEAPEVSHDPEVRALVEARLRVLHEDGPSASRLPWEVFKEELAQVRERLPLTEMTEQAAPVGEAVAERQPVQPLGRPDASPDELAADLERLVAGKKLGPYVLAEKLGEGGFGEVFRALMPVAIKFARTPAEVDRLRRLAELQGRVQSPRIVRPLEVDLESEPPRVVLEYVDGTTLRTLLRGGALPLDLALAVCREIALGLADAHRVGVAHLDLKPENVLLDTDGAIKLTDFDLAVPESDGLHTSLDFRTEAGPQGTLAYMSPEQRAGKAVDVRSDVYTYGVCLFEALTGTLPEPGDRPSDFVEDLPEAIDTIFERCFARQERRYANAGELVAALEDAGLEFADRGTLAARFAALPRRRRTASLPRALAETVIEAAPVLVEPEDIAEEPVTEEPVTEEPIAEEPAAEEPIVEEPVVEEPIAGESVAEESVAEEPVAEESVAEEPVAEEPVAEEPVSRPDLEALMVARELDEPAVEAVGERPALEALIAARAARAREAAREESEPVTEDLEAEAG